MSSHTYSANVVWTGNRGQGTANYRAYDRTHTISAGDKPPMPGSADTAFRGDADCWNPEDTLTGSISACHMLWFLHLASEAGWVVESYEDDATATMEMNADGSGQMTLAVLAPRVSISAGDPSLNEELHHKAHEKCFIARSLNFPVQCQAAAPVIVASAGAPA